MRSLLVLTALLLATPAFAAKHERPEISDQTVRLQIALDRAGFGPGVIDGRFEEFTRKAANLYLQSLGKDPVNNQQEAESALQDQLTTIPDAYTEYTVSNADLDRVGPLPSSVQLKAKQKWLGYQNAGEAVAERFHTEPAFLAKINPGVDIHKLAAGTTLKVPNVEQFDIAAVEQRKKEQIAKADSKSSGEHTRISSSRAKSEESPVPVAEAPERSVEIGTAEHILKVFDGDKLVAAFPVTCGSEAIPSPIGDWKVESINYLPIFRWDKKMLQTGHRSAEGIKLNPGPNSPVGVTWIALNKEGIGIHGTDDPESIGHAASHGCIRLSNWDSIRVADLVSKGTPVKINP